LGAPAKISAAAAVELFAELGILAMNICAEAQVCTEKARTSRWHVHCTYMSQILWV
jgi:hypothetical protein